jgi:hypothetical protein
MTTLARWLVMPGLDPGIYLFGTVRITMDRRVKPGDDE